jgi:hypothetical protein
MVSVDSLFNAVAIFLMLVGAMTVFVATCLCFWVIIEEINK